MTDLIVDLLHGEVEITGAVLLKQAVPQLWADGPVALQGIDIRGGNTALQVACYVLQIFGRLAVDVARQVEVERVLLDLREREPCARISGRLRLLLKTSTILWMSILRSRFLGPSFMKPPLASIMEDTLARLGVLFIDDHDASGDARAVEEIGQARPMMPLM